MRTLLDAAIVVWAVAMVVFHLISTQYLLLDMRGFNNVHLGLILGLVFLTYMRSSPRLWPLSLALFLLAMLGTGYVGFSLDRLELNAGFPTTMDLVIGAILVIVVIEATRQAMGGGWTLPFIAIIFIAYGWLGNHLPGVLKTYQISLMELIYTVSTFLQGIYSGLLGISANYIFLFVVFGGLLQAFGVSRFINQLGTLVGKLVRSGPAMMAVVSSGMIGSVIMSAAANVAIAGNYTIPMMKKVGYKPHQAAAIEVAASTSGQIMPPVMGSAAFMMVVITGIPYTRIMIAGLIPACLYLLAVGLYAHLQALKMGVKPLPGQVDLKELLLESRLFFGPLAVLIALLIIGFTPTYAVFWAILATVALGLMRPKKLSSFSEWLEKLVEGARTGAGIGVTLAMLGIVVKIITMTGLGVKFPTLVEAASGGNIYIALAMVAIICLVLGTALPTPPAYLLVALVAAPYLVNDLHVPMLQAHFFVFFYAVMSTVTPPTAQPALVAAAIAGTTYMKATVESMKPAIAGFLVPISFIWIPLVLGVPQPNLVQGIVALLGLMVALFMLQAAFIGYFFHVCSAAERFLLAICGVGLVLNVVWQTWLTFLLPVGIGVILALVQMRRKPVVSAQESA